MKYFVYDYELWNNIMLKAQEIGGEVLTCISEADEWAKSTFLEYDVFTILDL